MQLEEVFPLIYFVGFLMTSLNDSLYSISLKIVLLNNFTMGI